MSSGIPFTCSNCTFVHELTVSKKNLNQHVGTSNQSRIIICAICSLSNDPSSKACKYCKNDFESKSTKQIAKNVTQSPVGSTSRSCESSSVSSQIRVCNHCTYHNNLENTICQMCGGVLVDFPVSESSEQKTKEIQCKMCGNWFLICVRCSYQNRPGAVKCMLCSEKLESKKQDDLSKVCPVCNHEITPDVPSNTLTERCLHIHTNSVPTD